jgi:hypothetical protein
MLLRAHYKQAEEAGIRKAKPPVETPSEGIRLWAVFKRVRPMNRLRRTSEGNATLPAAPLRVGVGIPERRRARAYVYSPEPPLCICSRARH